MSETKEDSSQWVRDILDIPKEPPKLPNPFQELGVTNKFSHNPFSTQSLKNETEPQIVLLEAADSRHGHDFVLQQIGLEYNRQGIEPKLINLLRGSAPLAPEILKRTLDELKPQTIITAGAAAFRHWPIIKNVHARKISLWFDEPFLRAEAHGVVDEMKDAGKRSDTDIYCWDPFWSDRMLSQWGIPTKGLDLAANPMEYYTSTINLSDDAVFLGHLHSPKDIGHVVDTLNPLFKRIYLHCMDFIENNFQIPNWHSLIESSVMSMGDGDIRLYRDTETNQPMNLCSLRKAVWMQSKNALRVRMLKRALKVTNVTIFSEMTQLSHANEHELRGLLGYYGNKLKVFDTSGYESKKLCQLYHYGKIHLQATDPQSVYRGVPLRVFQTMASGKVLLTDTKRDWKEIFEAGKEALTYETEDQFEETLKMSLETPDTLKDIGHAARQRFLLEHTWEMRFRQMII